VERYAVCGWVVQLHSDCYGQQWLDGQQDLRGHINAPVVHHFAVSNISSPQTAGTSFNVTITALDSNNNTVTSFTGTVD